MLGQMDFGMCSRTQNFLPGWRSKCEDSRDLWLQDDLLEVLHHGDGQGIHWLDLDEDLSMEGMLQGCSSFESQNSRDAWGLLSFLTNVSGIFLARSL